MYNLYYGNPYHDYFRMCIGPVADPAPPFGGFRRPYPYPDIMNTIVQGIGTSPVEGHVADPGPEFGGLLDKEKLAELKVRELDMMVQAWETRLETVRALRDTLKKEYGIK